MEKVHHGFVGHHVCRGLPRMYLDKDDVLVDYHRAKNASGMDYDDFNAHPGSFLDLPWMPGAVEFLDYFGGEYFKDKLELWIVSKAPPLNPYGWTEKAMWLKKNRPDMQGRLILTPDKGCLGRPCDVLVDDTPERSNGQNFPGTLIRFTNWVDSAPEIQAWLERTMPEEEVSIFSFFQATQGLPLSTTATSM